MNYYERTYSTIRHQSRVQNCHQILVLQTVENKYNYLHCAVRVLQKTARGGGGGGGFYKAARTPQLDH